MRRHGHNRPMRKESETLTMTLEIGPHYSAFHITFACDYHALRKAMQGLCLRAGRDEWRSQI